MTTAHRFALPDAIGAWLDGHAQQLDTTPTAASALLPKLAEAHLFKVGVPREHGGDGAPLAEAVSAVAAVSARSLTAGFVFWGHRTFIEYLLQSPNAYLRDRLLPDLLSGRRAGATGLSNAMKFLNGIEALQVVAARRGGRFTLDGKLPWVTNLRKEGFDVAVAVESREGAPAFVVSLSSDDDGLTRSPDLDLMAMRGSNTAAIALQGVGINEDRILHADAADWLPRIRPAFLGLQCGMSIGLAARALAAAHGAAGDGRDVLAVPISQSQAELSQLDHQLAAGLDGSLFLDQPMALFRLRIQLAEIVNRAVQLELGATGGKAYLSAPGEAYQRRLRESAFIPVITPSLVQLESAIDAQQRRQAERLRA